MWITIKTLKARNRPNIAAATAYSARARRRTPAAMSCGHDRASSRNSGSLIVALLAVDRHRHAEVEHHVPDEHERHDHGELDDHHRHCPHTHQASAAFTAATPRAAPAWSATITIAAVPPRGGACCTRRRGSPRPPCSGAPDSRSYASRG